MTNLKEKLIRLGGQRPDLRRHLKPILDEITRTASSATNRRTSNLMDHAFGHAPMADGVYAVDSLNDVPREHRNEVRDDIEMTEHEGDHVEVYALWGDNQDATLLWWPGGEFYKAYHGTMVDEGRASSLNGAAEFAKMGLGMK